jgi:hypothetical protein
VKRTELFLFSLLLAATLSVAQLASGQSAQDESAAKAGATATQSSQATAATNRQTADVREGTKISAMLESQVDARTAKPGDKVVARVTKDVKQNGHAVIHKGDRLVGTVEKAEAGSTAEAGSSLTVAFNELASGQSTEQLHAVLTSVVSSPSEERKEEQMNSQGLGADEGGMMGGAAGGGAASSRGGGLGSTVGSTAGAAGRTAGSATRGIGGTADATTRATLGTNAGAGLATPIRDLHVSSQGNADNQTSAGSVLSTKHGDLRLESGTRMQFKVAAQSSASGSSK